MQIKTYINIIILLVLSVGNCYADTEHTFVVYNKDDTVFQGLCTKGVKPEIKLELTYATDSGDMIELDQNVTYPEKWEQGESTFTLPSKAKMVYLMLSRTITLEEKRSFTNRTGGLMEVVQFNPSDSDEMQHIIKLEKGHANLAKTLV